MLLVQTTYKKLPVSSGVSVRSGAVFVLIIPALVLYVGIAAYFNFISMIGVASLAEPISIDIQGPVASDWGAVAPTFAWPGRNKITGGPNERPFNHLENGFRWKSERTWVASIRLNATPDVLGRIDTVDVRVGPVIKTFSGDEIRTKWKRLQAERWALQDVAGPVLSLEVPWAYGRMAAVNWPSNSKLLREIALTPAAVALSLAMFLIGIWRLARRPAFEMRLEKLLTGSRNPVYVSRSAVSFLAGLATVVAGLCLLYGAERYPFTQDDNFCQFLPVILRSAETLAKGSFPVWNPYQLLGAPTASVGTYALTYPPTYLSYWVAHSLLRNDYLTLEVFAVMHLLLGYACCFMALRRFRISAVFAAAGSVCWVLSGWFLIGGRSQFNFTPLAVYLPLLVDAVNQIWRGRVTWKWAGATGMLIGLLFHAGHAELWIYTLLFIGIAFTIHALSSGFRWANILWPLTAFLIGAGIAAPLLLVQKAEVSDILRQAGYGWPSDIPHMLLPLGRLGSHGIEMGSVNHEYGLEFFYAGTLFTVAGIASLAVWAGASVFLKAAISKKIVNANLWLICGAVALLLACGADGILWPMLTRLPLFDKFRWPIKYTPFAQMFLIFGGSAILMRLVRDGRRQIWLSGGVAALMLLHVTLCRATWYSFGDRPYPELEASTQQVASGSTGKRLLTVAPFRSATTGFVQTLSLNFPTEYKLLSLDGYDTFVQTKPQYARVWRRLNADPVRAAQAYGVGTLDWAQVADSPKLSGNPQMREVETTEGYLLDLGRAIRGDSHPVSVTVDRKLYRAIPADPIAFTDGQPGRALPFDADQAGIRVLTAGLPAGTSLTVNFLRWPWITAEANGRALSPRADQWDRIQVTLPSPASEVVIRYSPPWARASLAGGGLILLAIFTGFLAMSSQQSHRRLFA